MSWGATYFHRCLRRPPEGSYRTHWMVCDACLPGFVPACAICGAVSPIEYTSDGFRAYPWGKLCPACVTRVRAGGAWKERRAHANGARARALCERFPSLMTTIQRRTTHVEGDVDGRAVHVRLRISAREGESERFIFHVAYAGPAETLSISDLDLDPKVLDAFVPCSLKVTIDRGRWLRIAFSRLGKLHTVDVLAKLLAAAERLERKAE